MSDLERIEREATERRNGPDRDYNVAWAQAEAAVDELIAVVKEWEQLYLSTVPAMNELGKQRDQARAAVLILRDLLRRDEQLMDQMADHIFNEALFVGNGTAIHTAWKQLVLDAQGELMATESYEQYR